MRKAPFSLVGVLAMLGLLGSAACEKQSTTAQQAAKSTFRIVAGSESKDLEPILKRFAAQQSVAISASYLGSVDIALQLQSGSVDTDAVLPASSLWIDLSDSKKVVRNAKSIMRSPVVFGVKMSVAKGLGWVNNPKVSVNDILSAAEKGKIRFAMTSATQSNSGASAYFGFLSALSGHPDILLHEHLNDVKVQDKTRRLLATVDRSSGSSGWLRDLMVKDEGGFDAMVNYEAMVISANRELVAQGREPLCAVYPFDGMTIADFPFGYVDHGDAAKAKFFAALQDYLLSAPVQAEIEQLGRRAGAVGLDSGSNAAVFNPAWCIDAKRTISPVPTPSEPVIREALDLYQTILRKPSFTVFVLDYSGSMGGEREAALKKGMETVLEPNVAKRWMLQPSARDVNIVMPFSNIVIDTWRVDGNDPANLRQMLGKIRQTNADGGTGLYGAVSQAMNFIATYAKAHPKREDPQHLSHFFPAIILMTDGEATDQKDVLDAYIAAHPETRDIPVFSIQFGEANKSQLEAISRNGRVFDGRKDVAKAIREAKQYN